MIIKSNAKTYGGVILTKASEVVKTARNESANPLYAEEICWLARPSGLSAGAFIRLV
jgi:hypothetical protein